MDKNSRRNSSLIAIAILLANTALQLILPSPSYASSVVLTEISFTPTYTSSTGCTSQSSFEWVEIKNTSGSDLDLSGWKVYDNHASDDLSGTISDGDYAVIAAKESCFRNNFPSFSGTIIDVGSAIGNGLADNGDKVTIKNQAGTIIDSVDFTADWPGISTIAKDSSGTWGEAFPPTPGESTSNIAGKVSGFVWEDTNGDGNQDPDELFLKNWTVVLSGEETKTDNDGYYEFGNLETEDYTLCGSKTGWTQTFPTGGSCQNITVQSGQTTEVSFGNFENGQISGEFYNDSNQNGQQDDGELFLENWTVYLDANDSGTLDDGEIQQQTDSAGHYSFTNIGPADSGNYVIRELLKANWTQTDPTETDSASGGRSDGSYLVVLNSGEQIHRNFGNVTQCSDGIDNDDDGLIDYPSDVDCDSLTDENESDTTAPISTFATEMVGLSLTIVPQTISGQTTDNSSGVNHGSIVLSSYRVGDPGLTSFDCSSAVGTEMVSLSLQSVINNPNDVSWSTSWSPTSSGSYCFKVDALDHSGNAATTVFNGPVSYVQPPPPSQASVQTGNVLGTASVNPTPTKPKTTKKAPKPSGTVLGVEESYDKPSEPASLPSGNSQAKEELANKKLEEEPTVWNNIVSFVSRIAEAVKNTLNWLINLFFS